MVNEALGIPDNITNVAVELLDRLAEKIPDKYNDMVKGYNFDVPVKFIIKGPFKIGDLVFLETKIWLILKIIKFGEHEKVIKFLAAGAKPIENRNTEKNVIDYNTIVIKLLLDRETSGEELRTYLRRKNNDLFDKVVHELKHTYDLAKNPEHNSMKDYKEYFREEGSRHIWKRYLSDEDYHATFPESLFKEINRTDKDKIEKDPVVIFFYYIYYTSEEENLARIPQFYAQILGDEVQKKNFKEYVEKNKIIADLKEMRDFSFEKFHGYIVDKVKKDRLYCYDKIRKLYLYDDEDLKYFVSSPELYRLDDKQIGEFVDKFLAVIFKIVKEASLRGFSDFIKNYVVDDGNSGKELENFKIEIQKLSKGNWRNFYEEGIRKIKKQADETLRKIYKLYALAK